MAKGTIIQPDKGKNKKGNKVNKKSLRKKLKAASKNISALYPSVKVVTLPNGSTQVEYGDDYFDEKIWASNGGKHPYKGQDLMENYIANKYLSGSMYRNDSYRALDLVKDAKSLGDLVDTMHNEGWYTFVGDVAMKVWGAHRVSHTCFWGEPSAELLRRKTLVEKIIHESETIERTDENIRTIETMFIDYDLEYISEGPVEASTLFQTRMRMKFGEPGSPLELVKRKTLSLDEANEQMKKMELSSSADEARQKITSANTNKAVSYEDDPLLQRKWDAIRDDAGSINAPSCLFSILGAQQENFLIQRHPVFSAGHKDDWTWFGDYQSFYLEGRKESAGLLDVIRENDEGKMENAFDLKQEQEANRKQQVAFQYFKESLRCPGMFAVPAWWYAETQHVYQLALAQYLTQHFDDPFPTGSFTSVVSRAPAWYSRQEQTNRKQYRKYLRETNDYMKSVVAAQEYPEMVPFNTTFINLEDEGTAGHLIYNRYLNQKGQVRQHMVPTTAFGPDGRNVPLDAIFQSGFYFHESKEGSPLGKRVVYGLYHGYVFSREHCPDEVPFIRIPMICPIHVDGRWYPNQPEFKHHFCHQSPIIPVIDMMIDALNEHKTVVRNFTKAERKRSVKVGRDSGAGKVTPRRYSRVQMSAGTTQIPPMEDCPLMQLPKWKLTKRIKCRKHERCYIRHGRLPLEVEHKELLLSRGYTIYKDNLEIGPRDAKRLKLRNIPWPDGFRWVAIRSIIVDEHERGPEGTEVVPLVLVPDSKVMKQSTQFELDSIGSPTK